MGSSVSRTSRIHNGSPDEIMLKIVKDPGGQETKTILIPKDGFKDVAYDIVDNCYNQGRRISIQIFHKGNKRGDIEIHQVRDYQTLTLAMDDKGYVTVVQKQEGMLLARLGISWKVKDAIRNMKRSIDTKPEKKRDEYSTKKHPDKGSEDVRITVEEG